MVLDEKKVKGLVHILVVIATFLYMLTGFGITKYRIVEPLTLGILTKSLSFKIHDLLAGPFVVLLVLHIYFALKYRYKKS